MITQHLDDRWTVRAAGGELNAVPSHISTVVIPATVPGCIHTDLMAAGLIPDPYYDRNELDLYWIGNTDWEYSTTFIIDEDLLEYENVELVCDGLDTVARLELNGKLIGNVENMHLAYRFDIGSQLQTGENHLRLIFTAPNHHAKLMEEQLGTRPYTTTNSPVPFNFIRKNACNFGWDWGPQLTTTGIWKPISIQAWDTGRIVAVRPLVEQASTEQATLDVLINVEHSSDAIFKATALLTSPDGMTTLERQASIKPDYDDTTLTLTLADPQLWWPIGHGDQPLYSLTVQLEDEDGNLLDSWSGQVGLRSVRLNTNPDDLGTKFTIEINGKPIFCKGANWIPDDVFVARVDEARYRQRLQQAVDANMNMLRIWGGGLYETDTFYRLCDEMGIMVWQDFLFACAAYPEEDPFYELIEAEARYNVTRLSRYASLVLWNGNNENIWGYFDWGWQSQLRTDDGELTWGKGYYLDLLPRIVSELDSSRPYWPGSPYSGTMEIHPLDDNHGPKHIWDAWNAVDYTIYRDYSPRFASEFGHQAPPTYATLKQSIPDDAFQPDSPSMLHHQKATNGNDKLNTRLGEHFAIPNDFDDWHYLTQLNQVRAVTTGVEWWRSRQPHCMGTLYWQINDCWPVTSWASVDGYGRYKPLWYATRRLYAGQLLTIQPQDGESDGLALFANNDTDQPWHSDVTIRRMKFDGTVLAEQHTSFDVPARNNAQVIRFDDTTASAGSGADEFIVATAGDSRAFWYFDIDRNLNYPLPEFDHSYVDGKLTITAKSFLRDIMIFPDRLASDATINEQSVTLLPGESFTFEITASQALSPDDLTTAPVFQCVNRFGNQ